LGADRSQFGPLVGPGRDQVLLSDKLLDVLYISREPRYAWNSAKQWPDPGELVTFTAHILNKGSTASGQFAYDWRIDGQLMQSGTAGSIFPQAESTQAFAWAWQTGRHFVSFRVDQELR
jgi:hypothetical protein